MKPGLHLRLVEKKNKSASESENLFQKRSKFYFGFVSSLARLILTFELTFQVGQRTIFRKSQNSLWICAPHTRLTLTKAYI